MRSLCPLLALTAILGCARAIPVPAHSAAFYEFTVEAPRERAFDQLLRVAHGLNLSVLVLEKSSGILRFENATLASMQLDTYCVYPFTNSRTQLPLDTFGNWNA